VRASLVGALLFVGACAVPDGGLFRAARFRDVHLYGRYTSLIVHGHVPYRDFFMEYPPGALAVFIPADAAGSAHYNAAFKSLMALCGVCTLCLVALLLVERGATRLRVWAATLLFGLSPLALGPISLNTYDAWPALLTVAALAALVYGRRVVAGAALGAAFAAKVYPLALLPLFVIWSWRRAGPRAAAQLCAACVAAVALFVAPFAALAPHGLAESFRSQAARGLQIESLGAQLLVAADHLGIYSARVVHRTHDAVSYDVVGPAAHALAIVGSLLQVAAAAGAAWLYGRRRDDAHRLAVASAAAVTGFLAFSRFFSPQYLVWLVPLVLLADAVAAWIVLAVALVLDQVWFFHYRSVVALEWRTWVVLVRDLLVVALVLLLLRRDAVEDEHAVVLEHESPLRVPT
jgi:uncharacterized membrane protein